MKQQSVLLALMCSCWACGDGQIPKGASADQKRQSDDATSAEPPVDVDADILEQLRSRPGLLVNEIPSSIDGLRVFDLYLTQPAVHKTEGSEEFLQHAYLLHSSRNAPMVFVSTGYDLPSGWAGYREEITLQLEANQLVVEERFFGDSRPEANDWSSLTIENAAADHHRFVQKLKPIYPENWIATGHSKGGMTSVYHARFFPHDLAGVVAYVAPISFDAPDTRFGEWLRQIGDDVCAPEIRRIELEAIEHLPEIVDRLSAADPHHAPDEIRNFIKHRIGTYTWNYWQAFDQCDFDFSAVSIYSASDAIEQFGLSTTDLDNGPSGLEAYVYQARHQLGFPDQVSPGVTAAVGPVDYLMLDAVSGGYSWPVAPEYDGGEAMQAVQDFISHDAKNILFIYGEYDPWSGGQFSTDENTNIREMNIAKIVVPARSHNALISDLSGATFAEATTMLATFAGIRDDIRPNQRRLPARLSPTQVNAVRESLSQQAARLRHHTGLLP